MELHPGQDHRGTGPGHWDRINKEAAVERYGAVNQGPCCGCEGKPWSGTSPQTAATSVKIEKNTKSMATFSPRRVSTEIEGPLESFLRKLKKLGQYGEFLVTPVKYRGRGEKNLEDKKADQAEGRGLTRRHGVGQWMWAR